jgi:hypothetical protein
MLPSESEQPFISSPRVQAVVVYVRVVVPVHCTRHFFIQYLSLSEKNKEHTTNSPCSLDASLALSHSDLFANVRVKIKSREEVSHKEKQARNKQETNSKRRWARARK